MGIKTTDFPTALTKTTNIVEKEYVFMKLLQIYKIYIFDSNKLS